MNKTRKMNLWQKYKNQKKGFTLIELLVVIAIIAMLVTAGTVSWRNAQMKSRDAKRKTDLSAIQGALERYYNDNGKYPKSTTAGEIYCHVGSVPRIQWIKNIGFNCSKAYMYQIPLDPIGEDQYFYFSDEATDKNQKYKLGANLENANDPDRLNCSIANCDIGSETRNYIVTNP